MLMCPKNVFRHAGQNEKPHQRANFQCNLLGGHTYSAIHGHHWETNFGLYIEGINSISRHRKGVLGVSGTLKIVFLGVMAGF